MGFRTYVRWEDGFECHFPVENDIVAERIRVITDLVNRNVNNFVILTVIDGGLSQ